jgi:hypothetical protein
MIARRNRAIANVDAGHVVFVIAMDGYCCKFFSRMASLGIRGKVYTVVNEKASRYEIAR